MRVIRSAYTDRYDPNITCVYVADVSMPGHPGYEARLIYTRAEPPRPYRMMWNVTREGGRGDTVHLGQRVDLAGALELARAGEPDKD